MKNITDKIYNLYNKFGSIPFLIAIRRAFTFLIPVFIIGACALSIQCLPISSVRNFILTALNGKINEFLTAVYQATYGFAAIYLVMVLSYQYSRNLTKRMSLCVFSVISTIICYFASLGTKVLLEGQNLLEYTKMTNVFSALVITLMATKLFFIFYNLLNKNKTGYESTFILGMHSLFPTVFCVVIFTLITQIFRLIPNINNFNDLIIMLLNKPFEAIGATYWGGFFVMLMESVLWMFGVHGGNVYDSLLNSQTGVFSFTNGQIMNKPFVDTFVLMGGCGTSISLFLAILLFTSDHKKKKICKLSSLPIMFNINEIIVFGIPIVLNPIYIIPFILTPLISYSLAYLFTFIGLVPPIINPNVQWTTPVLISGFQATGSIMGAILQVVSIVIGVLIYMPFVKLDNRFLKVTTNNCINDLTKICKACEDNEKEYEINNNSIILHAFEDDLASKLYEDIVSKNINIRYQPQVKDGKIISAEALLRFKYDDSDYLYPPLIVNIAVKNNLFEMLSKAIIEKAIEALKQIQKINHNFKIAVNLKIELLMNNSFNDWLIEQVKKSKITPYTFGIEITEDAKLIKSINYSEIFANIKKAGIEILMDDFSMGHTSIAILQMNYFDYVKIDGSLIKDLNNDRSRSIVASITNLGKELKFEVIAEYVETKEQRDYLLDLDCHIFQGYLYYKDMPLSELENIVLSQTNKN